MSPTLPTRLTPAVAKNTSLASADQTINFLSVRAGSIWQPTTAQAYYVWYSTSFDPALEQLTGTAGQTTLDPKKQDL